MLRLMYGKIRKSKITNESVESSSHWRNIGENGVKWFRHVLQITRCAVVEKSDMINMKQRGGGR